MNDAGQRSPARPGTTYIWAELGGMNKAGSGFTGVLLARGSGTLAFYFVKVA